MRSIMNIGNENESTHKEDTDALQFLEAQNKYITVIKLLSFPKESSDEANDCGWEDNDYYYLINTDTWSCTRAYLKRN